MTAASIIQPDHSLEERIYHLQKRDLSAGVRQTLEEAAQLLGEGKQIEASALVDKVEAISSSASPGEADRAIVLTSCREGDGSNSEQALAARLVADLANGLAKVLVGAVQGLERHITDETKLLRATFGSRLDRIQANVECLQPLAQRLESLVQAGAAVEARYDQLAATTAYLQEASSRHEAETTALRLWLEELSGSTRDRLNEFCHRMEEQERQISTASSNTSELTTRIEAAAERLERHAGAIRSLHQAHQQRAAALDQVAEVFGRMRTAEEIPDAMAAL